MFLLLGRQGPKNRDSSNHEIISTIDRWLKSEAWARQCWHDAAPYAAAANAVGPAALPRVIGPEAAAVDQLNLRSERTSVVSDLEDEHSGEESVFSELHDRALLVAVGVR